MRAFLTPVEAVHPRPEDPGAARYVRAFLILRVMVGALGIALPFALTPLQDRLGETTVATIHYVSAASGARSTGVAPA